MNRKILVVLGVLVLVWALPAAYIHFFVTADLDDQESEVATEWTVFGEAIDRLSEEINENIKEVDERLGAVMAAEEAETSSAERVIESAAVIDEVINERTDAATADDEEKAVVKALEDINEEQLIDTFIVATVHLDAIVRKNAVGALYHFYGHASPVTASKIVSAFLVALDDEVQDVSSVASSNLTNIFCVEPIESLISFSQAESATVVDLAIEALVARVTECSFAQLDSIINSHPNPKLVNAAMLVYHEWQHDLSN